MVKLEGCIDDERQFKTAKRSQAPGDATALKRFFRVNIVIMDARSASVHVIFCRCFFMPALVGQTAERIFTKLSHVVDITHHLRTY